MEFKDKIKHLREKNNMSLKEVADKVGVSAPTIQRYETGEIVNVRRDKIANLAKALNTTPAYLMGWNDYWDEKYNKDGKLAKEVKKIEEGTRIPVAGDVAAGIPIEAIEDIIDYEEIPLEMAKSGKFFGLRIKGDSMYPRIIEGDIVIVRQQEDADSGDIVIAKVNGNEATCKKLIKNEDGITLQPFNPNFDPMYFSNEDIINKPVCIIGKVVENRQKY